MPIVTFHLSAERFTSSQLGELLTASGIVYAEALSSPVDRVRAFVRLYPAELCLVAGGLVNENHLMAPFFEFIVLAGRPLAQRHHLLGAFTDLLVEHLGVVREHVRGRAIEVDPEDWTIGGVPASILRADEIRAREAAAK